MMNIYVLSSVLSGKLVLDCLNREIKITGLISLNRNDGRLSGYYDYSDYCKSQNIKHIPLDDIRMSDAATQTILKSLDIDILLVLGWQRIIPGWFLNQVRICTVGTHGTPCLFEKGRGNSPINWSIILQEKFFYPTLFLMDEQVDAGDILARNKIRINDYDTVETIYFKFSAAVAVLLSQFISNMNVGCIKGKKQKRHPSYFPKRYPDDGCIDWQKSAAEINALIRGTTRPYPGAYTNCDNKKVVIYHAIPMEQLEAFDEYPCGWFHLGKTETGKYMVVKCMNSVLYVTDFDDCVLTKDTGFFTYPQLETVYFGIINRYRTRYPDRVCYKKLIKKAQINRISKLFRKWTR